MRFAKFSISIVTQLIMNDLGNYYNDTKEYLSSEARTDLESWIEWAVDSEIQHVEKEEIMNEIHEGLQFMNIWHYEQYERTNNINKIRKYFRTKYSEKEYVRKFESIVVEHYIEELKHN